MRNLGELSANRLVEFGAIMSPDIDPQGGISIEEPPPPDVSQPYAAAGLNDNGFALVPFGLLGERVPNELTIPP